MDIILCECVRLQLHVYGMYYVCACMAASGLDSWVRHQMDTVQVPTQKEPTQIKS